METDNETSFRLSVSVTLIHSRPLKKPAPSPGQISTGTGGQFSPGANNSFNIVGDYFPIVQLIEAMHERGWLELEIVEQDLMPDDYGLTLPKKNKIRIREDVYDQAVAGDGFGRFTMAHELGHLVIHRQETVYARNEHGGCHKTIEDSEWQADKFAQELLIDTRLLSPGDSLWDIAKRCGVTIKAADTAYKSLIREGVLK